ncbi:hypothetical protein VE02_09470 [Pseudogymnoascus sp. 03VT05]|nr:hypothetical protein VE02_09470 [Pseudogymnoascus sp. 03VT05]
MSRSGNIGKDAEESIAVSPVKDIKDLGPPSLMTRKFMGAEESNYSYPPPRTLAKVLKLNNLPPLVPAKISGYHCKLWGDYPALAGGEPDEPVYGMTYEVQLPEENELLQAYETDRYLRVGCIVEFEDGTEVVGSTFKRCGDKTELKEGDFDLKDWKIDMLEREIGSARHQWLRDL